MTTTTRTEFDVGSNCLVIVAVACVWIAIFLWRCEPKRYEPPTRVSTPMHQVYPADPRPGPHNQ